MLGALGTPIEDGSHSHARNAVGNLVREPLAHKAGADHADANGLPLLLPGL